MTQEEMLNLLPPWFQEIKEFPEIMKAYGAEFEELQANIERVANNTHIQTCDLQTVEYWEKKLKITPPIGATLEDRRNTIQGRFTVSGGYTLKKLYQTLTEMYGKGTITWYALTPWYLLDWGLEESLNRNSYTFRLITPKRNGILDFLRLWYAVAPAHTPIHTRVNSKYDIQTNPVYVGGAASYSIQYNAE